MKPIQIPSEIKVQGLSFCPESNVFFKGGWKKKETCFFSVRHLCRLRSFKIVVKVGCRFLIRKNMKMQPGTEVKTAAETKALDNPRCLSAGYKVERVCLSLVSGEKDHLF